MNKKYTKNGYTLHIIPSKKFKNISISCKLVSKLTKKNATKRTLLSLMLTAGTNQFPSTRQFSEHLENMYGARISSSIGSKGLGHVIHLSSVCVNEVFLPTDDNLFDKQVELFKQVLLEPNIKEGLFDESVLNIKKKELKERIRVNNDDKFSYSFNKLLEIMGKDQTLGISSIGYLEEIDSITNQELVEYFYECINTDQKHIYVVGDISEKQLACFDKHLSFTNEIHSLDTVIPFNQTNIDINEVIETQEITQAKLNMGYSIDCNYLNDDHYAFTVFNAMFGGFAQSKLFKVVREKHSLCYYISSSYDAFNSVMIVSAGIENEDYNKTKELVNLQLSEIQNGNILEEELSIAKKMLSNALTKANDETSSMIALAFNRDVTGKNETNEEYLNKLMDITIEDIIRVSNSIKLDTIFLLTGGNY